MKIIDRMEKLLIEDETAVAIGKFDGIHLGHQALLKEILTAGESGLKSAVFTFYPSPAVVFGGGEAMLRAASLKEQSDVEIETRFQTLSTREEKRRFLAETGIDYFVEYPLNLTTASVEPTVFIEKILVERMHAKLVVAGPDLSFGRQGRGNFTILKQYSDICRYEARQIDKVCMGGREISSTRVREAVERGDMEEAEKCLGSFYAVSGIVTHGAELGRNMGFPTLNLTPEKEKLLPPFGVYYSLVTINGIRYAGITNIGKKPTVLTGGKVTVETFLLHFHGNAYGESVKIELLKFVRAERKFDNQADLSAQIGRDVKQAEEFFKEFPNVNKK